MTVMVNKPSNGCLRGGGMREGRILSKELFLSHLRRKHGSGIQFLAEARDSSLPVIQTSSET
jgi:hypothetical protein